MMLDLVRKKVDRISLPKDARFCSNCGSPLRWEKVCPKCGVKIDWFEPYWEEDEISQVEELKEYLNFKFEIIDEKCKNNQDEIFNDYQKIKEDYRKLNNMFDNSNEDKGVISYLKKAYQLVEQSLDDVNSYISEHKKDWERKNFFEKLIDKIKKMPFNRIYEKIIKKELDVLNAEDIIYLARHEVFELPFQIDYPLIDIIVENKIEHPLDLSKVKKLNVVDERVRKEYEKLFRKDFEVLIGKPYMAKAFPELFKEMLERVKKEDPYDKDVYDKRLFDFSDRKENDRLHKVKLAYMYFLAKNDEALRLFKDEFKELVFNSSNKYVLKNLLLNSAMVEKYPRKYLGVFEKVAGNNIHFIIFNNDKLKYQKWFNDLYKWIGEKDILSEAAFAIAARESNNVSLREMIDRRMNQYHDHLKILESKLIKSLNEYLWDDNNDIFPLVRELKKISNREMFYLNDNEINYNKVIEKMFFYMGDHYLHLDRDDILHLDSIQKAILALYKQNHYLFKEEEDIFVKAVIAEICGKKRKIHKYQEIYGGSVVKDVVEYANEKRANLENKIEKFKIDYNSM